MLCTNKVGILYQHGKYRLMAGLSGPDKDQQTGDLIAEERTGPVWNAWFKKDKEEWVFAENTIELFKGSIAYVHEPMVLTNSNVKVYNWHTSEEITHFSLDTIAIEPLMNPDLMYRDALELYYFAGIHEIFHTRAANILLQIQHQDHELEAMKLERKAFKQRKRINRRMNRSQGREQFVALSGLHPGEGQERAKA